MTKQKFYEELVLKSYANSGGTAYEAEAEKLSNMMEWPPESFDELLLKRTICGFQPDIPRRQPFDKLGFKYLAQIIGFVVRMQDDELTYDFFEFLDKVKDDKRIIDVKDEDQVAILYESYYDTLCGENNYSDFTEKMADFILLNCEGTEYHKKTLTLSYALGRTNKVGLTELLNMKRRQAGLEPVDDLFGKALRNAV